MVNQESESFISTNNECVIHQVSNKSVDEQMKSTSDQNWKSFLSKGKTQINPARIKKSLEILFRDDLFKISTRFRFDIRISKDKKTQGNNIFPILFAVIKIWTFY